MVRDTLGNLFRLALAAVLLLGNGVLPSLHLGVDHGHGAEAAAVARALTTPHHDEHATADCSVCDLIRIGRSQISENQVVISLTAPVSGVVHLVASRDIGVSSLQPASSRAPPAEV